MERGSRTKSAVAEAPTKREETGREVSTGIADRHSPEVEVLSDDELAQRVRKGDDAAWTMLVMRYRLKVFLACWRSCGNVASAQDLTQDVWLRFWRTRETIRDGGFVKRLNRIIRSVCVDEWRSPWHRVEVPGDEDGTADANPHTTYIDVPDGEDVKIFVEEMLAVLKTNERRILLERVVEGMTLLEIGEEEGCSHTQVNIICGRAMRKLREFAARRRPL